MKFKIIESVWEHSGLPRLNLYVECGKSWDYLIAVDNQVQAKEFCKNYKLAREAEPKVTYLEI